MSDPDSLLADLWAADEPPERDPGFVLSAMEAIERRQLWLNMAALGVIAGVIGLVSWAVAPEVAAMARALFPADTAIAATLSGAGLMSYFLWSWASDRLRPLEV
jgi:hypothetical protein